MTKEFHIGDVLSITSGILVAPSGMDGICAILDHMTGESLFTHSLPRAARACEPVLLEQFPELTEIEVPTGMSGREEVDAWLAGIVEAHGATRQVAPLAEWESKDPIVELIEIRTRS